MDELTVLATVKAAPDGSPRTTEVYAGHALDAGRYDIVARGDRSAPAFALGTVEVPAPAVHHRRRLRHPWALSSRSRVAPLRSPPLGVLAIRRRTRAVLDPLRRRRPLPPGAEAELMRRAAGRRRRRVLPWRDAPHRRRTDGPEIQYPGGPDGSSATRDADLRAGLGRRTSRLRAVDDRAPRPGGHARRLSPDGRAADPELASFAERIAAGAAGGAG